MRGKLKLLTKNKMLKKKLAELLKRRYFWRDIGFDELSELYISNMLRIFAVSLLMVFVPFYLYQHNYSLSAIFVTFGLFFVGRIFCDVAAAYSVGYFGPKHTMIISCLLQIISASLFLTVPIYHWPVWLLGPVYGAGASFFFIAFNTEFSKIKHTLHAGKELGYMQMFEKVGGVLGPLIGGIVGSLFGPQAIFLLAVGFLFGSLWPLFRSAEPVKTRQHLSFRTLPVEKVKRDILAYAGQGVENTLCINVWPLYVSLFALSGTVYAQLGLLTAFGVLASIMSAYFIGHTIDVHNARLVLRVSAVLNALLYVFRPFVHSIGPALAVNLANEAITTGYRMPMMKGVYAAADDLPGHRIVYIASLELIATICKATAWFALAIVALSFSVYTSLVVAFVIAGFASLVILTEKFKALNPKRNII
jgi:MFS family permease